MAYLQRMIRIIHYNVKITCNLNLAAALVLTLITPIFFSLRMLSFNDIAVIGEYYLSITGIILFSYIGDIDKRDKTEEILYWRKTPHILMFITRILIMMSVTFVLVISIIIYAKFNNGDFDILKLAGGVWVSAVFLGLIGLTVANLTGNITSGYLISFAYYGFELFTRGKYTGKIYLFSLTNSSFNEKYMLLLIILILCAVNIVYVYKKS